MGCNTSKSAATEGQNGNKPEEKPAEQQAEGTPAEQTEQAAEAKQEAPAAE